MERNNGRYAYIRRQGSGSGGHQQQHNHHHHSTGVGSVNNSTSTTGASSASGNSVHNTQYSNSMNNVTVSGGGTAASGGHNSNALYAAVSTQQQQLSQHDELIRYINEAWNKVSEQNTPVIYCNDSENQLKNFKPFNLEEYWGQRLVQNIHVSTTHGGGHQ